MKRLAAFLKATTLGGLFVLLPVVVVLGIAAKTVLGVRETAQTVNPGSGNVQIVPKSRVRMLNVPITDIALALQQLGVGSAKVLAKHATRQSADTPPAAPQS